MVTTEIILLFMLLLYLFSPIFSIHGKQSLVGTDIHPFINI